MRAKISQSRMVNAQAVVLFSLNPQQAVCKIGVRQFISRPRPPLIGSTFSDPAWSQKGVIRPCVQSPKAFLGRARDS